MNKIAHYGIPKENCIFSYDGPHGEFFQELIAKSNEKFRGTKAEIPEGKSGEVKNMNIIRKMALVSTIVNNPNLLKYGLFPMTGMQSECSLKAGNLQAPCRYSEDLDLLLYDSSPKGANSREAQMLEQQIRGHEKDLFYHLDKFKGERIIIASVGAEPVQDMKYGIRPVIISGITEAWPCRILEQSENNHEFIYGLQSGLPYSEHVEICEKNYSPIYFNTRRLFMPLKKLDIGLRILQRHQKNLHLSAEESNLAHVPYVEDKQDWGSRITFVSQKPLYPEGASL
ncbi:MAG: hypothetical protein ACOYT4_04610 [Nanoarchaeota archaeon]